MKSMSRIFSRMTFFGVMLVTTAAFAQSTVKETKETTTTTTTTSSSGTISEFGKDVIVVKTTTSTDPIRYSYTKTTTYVDEKGNPVSIETVKTGLPVTVYYDKEGNKMVATKVVVTKAVTAYPPR